MSNLFLGTYPTNMWTETLKKDIRVQVGLQVIREKDSGFKVVGL